MVSTRDRWLGAVVVVLQLAAGLPYFVSGLIAPPPAVLVLKGLWVAFSVVAVVVFRRNPPLGPVVPAVTVFVGVACLVLGGTFLNWEG